ncbi:putative ribonuclease H-like domain-containing protein [Tanacetum coccineum]
MILLRQQLLPNERQKLNYSTLALLPEDHMADFSSSCDAKDIWLAVKARFRGNEESKKIENEEVTFAAKGQRPDNEKIQHEVLNALPLLGHGGNHPLKPKGGLNFFSFDDFYTTTFPLADASGNVLEKYLFNSFVAESDPQQPDHLRRPLTINGQNAAMFDKKEGQELSIVQSFWEYFEENVQGESGFQDKLVGLHVVPGPITGTFMPPLNKPDIDDTTIHLCDSPQTQETTALHHDNPHTNKDLGIVDSGCSRSMTGNKEKLADFVKIKGGTVTFGGGDGKITGKGTIRTSNFNFENVYYVEELQNFNLFSVSQICDTKNKVLFTDKECLVLSKEFQLPDSSQVVLRVPRRHNLYCFNLTDIHSEREIKCLLAKASLDESTKWHRRMAHVNFKNMNKLAKHGLVNGLPSKLFTNENNYVACNKGKQHKASYMAITVVSTIFEPLQFSWVFFLGTNDETFYILRDFITFVENQLTKKVKAIRCDNGTEFKNSNLIELYGSKGIKRDYSVARTPQQNRVAERKNRTLIEAARTMLADSKLPTMFWTEAVSTACYVLNRVLVTRPHNKTPYELLSGKVPNISHLKPFGCHVTILNTSDHLGKFEGKADEGFLVGYSAHSKTYRVYNLSNKKIEETLNLRYMEDKPNVQGLGHEWYFDLDYLTASLGYTHSPNIITQQGGVTQDTNTHAGTHDDSDSECDEQVIVVPSFPSNHFSGPKVHTASATVETKDTWKIADTVPAGSGVPATSIPAGSINQAAGGSAVPSTPSSSVIIGDIYFTSSRHRDTLRQSKFGERLLQAMRRCNSLLIRMCRASCAFGQKGNCYWDKMVFLRKLKEMPEEIVVRNKAGWWTLIGHRQAEAVTMKRCFLAPVARELKLSDYS